MESGEMVRATVRPGRHQYEFLDYGSTITVPQLQDVFPMPARFDVIPPLAYPCQIIADKDDPLVAEAILEDIASGFGNPIKICVNSIDERGVHMVDIVDG